MINTDVDRLPALIRHLASIDAGTVRTKTGDGRETTVEVRARIAAEVAAIIEGLADLYLLSGYQRTGREPGNPEADALLAEIERRGLDV